MGVGERPQLGPCFAGFPWKGCPMSSQPPPYLPASYPPEPFAVWPGGAASARPPHAPPVARSLPGTGSAQPAEPAPKPVVARALARRRPAGHSRRPARRQPGQRCQRSSTSSTPTRQARVVNAPIAPPSANHVGVVQLDPEDITSNVVRLDPLLLHLMEVGGSDLHMAAGSPPRVRVRGEMAIIPNSPHPHPGLHPGRGLRHPERQAAESIRGDPRARLLLLHPG